VHALLNSLFPTLMIVFERHLSALLVHFSFSSLFLISCRNSSNLSLQKLLQAFFFLPPLSHPPTIF